MVPALLSLAGIAVPAIKKHFDKSSVTESIVNIAKDVTGLNSVDDAVGAILGNNEKILAFQEKVREHEITLLRMANEDIANARTMQITALQQDDVFSKRFIYYFATAWSLFAMTYIPCITFLNVPEESIRFADTILGFLLGTVIASILTFFFGSSHGSKDKTDALKDVIKRKGA